MKRYHLTPIRMTIIKKTVSNVGEDLKKRKPLYTVGGDVNWFSYFKKQYGSLSKN